MDMKFEISSLRAFERYPYRPHRTPLSQIHKIFDFLYYFGVTRMKITPRWTYNKVDYFGDSSADLRRRPSRLALTKDSARESLEKVLRPCTSSFSPPKEPKKKIATPDVAKSSSE